MPPCLEPARVHQGQVAAGRYHVRHHQVSAQLVVVYEGRRASLGDACVRLGELFDAQLEAATRAEVTTKRAEQICSDMDGRARQSSVESLKNARFAPSCDLFRSATHRGRF